MPLGSFGRGFIKNIRGILFGILTSGSGDVVLNISYLQIWRPSCSTGRTHLGNLSRGHYEEHFCDIFFEFGPVVQEEL